jgi:Metallo-peptidase family M12/Reprolysin family propeptide
MKSCLLPKLICLAICIASSLGAFAQSNRVNLLANYAPLPTRLAPYLQKGQVAIYDRQRAAALLQNRPATLNMGFRFENSDWELELEQNDLFSPSFAVTTGTHPQDKFAYDATTVLHYKGRIKGKPRSFAAVSILNNQLVGVMADEKGNINIGLVKDAPTAGEHIIYRESDLRIANEFSCGTDGEAAANSTPIPTYDAPPTLAATLNAEPVDMYYEADYSIYTNNSSNVTNVVNYVTSLFNVVRTLYDNDSVNMKISGIKVWNTVDPYAGTANTSTALTAFSTAMSNGFPGDLAHLLSQRGLGGGRAYIDVLCSGNSVKTGVDGNLSNSFGAFPVYSWSAMVITHETGHNLGSPHTQSCSWPGGAIDNCYTTEGGCAAGPAPVNGGTIMSYCHLVAAGINFANGFGPLPGERIRSRIRNSTCINPGVYFETTFQNVTEETADVDNGCLDYKLMTTKLSIPYKPSQPAGITLVPTGNAGLTIGTNADVEISPMSFVLDSANLSQTISVKVYNDASIENVESLTLNFNLNANGGNAIKRSTSTVYTLNITSLDHRPDSSINEPLFYESFDTVTTGLGAWTQTVVYGNPSPNRWVIRNSGDTLFPSKSAYISNNGTAYAYSGTTAADSTVVRLISPTINATSFTNMRLGYLYRCNGQTVFVNGGSGTSGGLTGLDVGRVYYSIDNGASFTLLKDNIAGRNTKSSDDVALPAAANNSSTLRIAFEWINSTATVNNPPILIDSITIKGTSVTAIQTATHVANNTEAPLGPNATVHFYNPVTKNIMASLQNLSSHDFGCTKVELLRTGSGASVSWSALTDEKVSAKAYRITASNNNASAPYRLTLYYTNSEVASWMAATGNDISSVSIVKTDSNITQMPPASLPVFCTNKVTANYGPAAHTAISGDFTGFSSFALAKPIAAPLCPGSNISYAASIAGTGYRWQVNTGTGYVDIMNGGVYAGAGSDTLRLTAPPTGYYGYKFRCVVTTGTGVVNSQEYQIKFGVSWLGGLSKLWESPSNWACGVLPDANTDVYINAGASFYPEVSANTTIRSLSTKPGTTVSVKNGVVLTVRQ